MKKTRYSNSLVALLGLCLGNLASADGGWTRGNAGPNIVPQDIRATTQIVAVSGDEVDIYYPAPPRKHIKSYPLVIFLQGALVDKRYYSRFAQGVAQHGFVVAVPNHYSELLGGQQLFAELKVINQVLEHVRIESDTPESVLYGRADTYRLAVSGHSFGGLATLAAAGNMCGFPVCDPAEGFQRPPELEAVVSVAGHAGELDLDTSGIPAAILVGDLDIPFDYFEATYANLEPPKALMYMAGSNHFGLADINEPPGANIPPEDPEQTVPQSISATQFAYWAGRYLRAHIHHDRKARKQVYRSDGDADVTIEAGSR